ncbi:MAG TPA: hypothetical protein VHB72_04020 [Candidatus Saccharimonadales bacterium]|nr:hypothetical protein [Candidatus Saccharimonadales bacterium]
MTKKNIHPTGKVDRIVTFLGSRKFFIGIMVVFLLEAAWIALSGRYPMAFDEDFHLGIIRLYAHHISPFWNSHPAGSEAYGAVTRDPSYLYQYLMSFPYRLITAITSSQAAQVLFLRFISIGMFAASLPLYRRLLLKSGASRALVQLSLGIFILIPIVPLLAAQINYDNLLMPLTALSLLLSVNFVEELERYKRIDVKLLFLLAITGLLTSLVKYAFLPILLVEFVYVAVAARRAYPSAKKFWLSVGFGLTLMTRRIRTVLMVLVLLSATLFVQRYGVNIVRYHTPVPDCGAVLTVQQCSAYPPWNRDYSLAQTKADRGGTDSPLVFSADWFYGMWMRSFFAVDGPNTNFQTRGPFILPGIGAIVFASAGAVMAAVSLKRMFKRYDGQILGLFVAVTGVYVLLLWADEYHSFLRTGQAVAINGRYLLPVLPLLLTVLALGVHVFLRARDGLKLAFATAAVVCMLWGGGALTYILRSNNAWYWPNRTVQNANHAVRQVLGPVTPGYRSPGEFMGRN